MARLEHTLPSEGDVSAQRVDPQSFELLGHLLRL